MPRPSSGGAPAPTLSGAAVGAAPAPGDAGPKPPVSAAQRETVRSGADRTASSKEKRCAAAGAAIADAFEAVAPEAGASEAKRATAATAPPSGPGRAIEKLQDRVEEAGTVTAPDAPAGQLRRRGGGGGGG
jgi:hypothetical protein